MRATWKAIAAAATIALTLSGCASVYQGPTVPLDAAKLVGTWDLAQVGARPVSRAIWLQFGAGGQLRGAVMCNRFSGSYEVHPPRIVYSDPIIITAAGCHPDWPDSGQLVERAEEVLFRGDPVVELTPDGRKLLMRGEDDLLFTRR